MAENLTQDDQGNWVPAKPIKPSIGTRILMWFDKRKKR